jgi:hypothetical protein
MMERKDIKKAISIGFLKGAMMRRKETEGDTGKESDTQAVAGKRGSRQERRQFARLNPDQEMDWRWEYSGRATKGYHFSSRKTILLHTDTVSNPPRYRKTRICRVTNQLTIISQDATIQIWTQFHTCNLLPRS